MTKPSPELKNLFLTYLRKPLRPAHALEFSSEFVLDLINAFGDKLNAETPLKPEWQEFSPFPFILELNALLAKYKQQGFDALDDVEKTLLQDTQVMLGTIIATSLEQSSTPSEEERFQIPISVARDLEYLLSH